MTNVYLVRHGETDFNRAHIVQGQLDTHGLNDTGRLQAKLLADFVGASNLKGDAILSSPQMRARETAEPLAALFGVAIQTDPRLKEVHFGRYEGVSTKDIRAEAYDPPLVFRSPEGGEFAVENGDVLRKYHASNDPRYDTLSHPGGETKIEARARACDGVFSYLEKHPETKNLWVVTHGALARFLTAHFAPVGALDSAVKNASVLHFTYDAATPRKLAWQGLLHAPHGAISY